MTATITAATEQEFLPGWTLKIKGVNGGLYKISMTGSPGKKAEMTNSGTQENIIKCVSRAFELERETSTNWNKFLFDLAMLRFNGQRTALAYFDDHTGSWLIQLKRKRVSLDAAMSLLMLQEKQNNDWTIVREVALKCVTLDRLLGLVIEAKLT